MIEYTFKTVSEIIGGEIISSFDLNTKIKTLTYDTRTLSSPAHALFFAISTEKNNGHKYLKDAYSKGVRNFVIEDDRIADYFGENFEANILKAKSSIDALQKLAAQRREEFNIPIVAITGSNGKTIVKEWLFQLLNTDFKIVRSPKSYNSQIGVPLSVWLMQPEHNFAIIEAGISKPGEMERLEKVIQPTIGIFTNIGEAHQAQFKSIQQKAEEKLKLFKNADLLIYSRDESIIHELVQNKVKSDFFSPEIQLLDWSLHDTNAAAYIEKGEGSEYIAWFDGEQTRLTVPFTDTASVENIIHCWVLMLHLGYSGHVIQARMDKLHRVEMRLEIKSGINSTTIINDSYNSDLISLSIALDTLNTQNQHHTKRLILSDIFESGQTAEKLYARVAEMIGEKGVMKLIGIGQAMKAHSSFFEGGSEFYTSTEEFLSNYDFQSLRDEAILLKGSRAFGFEAIAARLQQKTHQTILEINLNALAHNLNVYKELLNPFTKIMAMVKAFSYGSGSYEIANMLQFNKVDYLAVAYADEGVYLREQGITVPVMVMNPEETAFEQIIRYNLEPEIYSLRVLESFTSALKIHHSQNIPLSVHIKLDTGMHRLGFEERDVDILLENLAVNNKIRVASIFTHLAAADDESQDDFTRKQAIQFENISQKIISRLGYPVLRHVLNSPGAVRFNDLQYDMIRLGIGLYGIDPSGNVQSKLENVTTLKTHISQIRNVPKGESVGYSRKAIMQKDSVIATIGIGYADGFPRILGNGRFKVLVNGLEAPVTGNVCMDMSMIDITEITAEEGDEVLIFGADKPINQMAAALGTIAYEILTQVSQRVKRVYYKE